MKLSFFKSLLSAGLLVLAASFSSCEKDNGELGQIPVADFSVSPVAGKRNTYLLSSTAPGAFRYLWNKGDGNFEEGQAVDTAYFLLKGTYEIVLRAYGRGGYDEVVQTVVVAEDDLTPILTNPLFQKLTATGWKLDASPGANTVIVGTENAPWEYFGGGPLADCQIDDIYRFRFDAATNRFLLSYNANGSTFNAGNIDPNYNCSADRSYTDQPFTFSTTVQGAGIATITLPGQAVPNRFIGVTDVSSNNYRIISISDTEMVLRSGTASQTVHQFKFVAE